jgi:localization factor PodJL
MSPPIARVLNQGPETQPAAQPLLQPAAVDARQAAAPAAVEYAPEGASALEMPPAAIGPTSLRIAAQRGDPSAEFEVAARFAEGRGVKQDFKLAMGWYQRSAQKGLAVAQYRLGTLYERGMTGKPDLQRARIWYKRSAEQGNVKAMHNLAVLSAGREGAPDYTTAAQWFTEAAGYGLADSQFNLGVLHETGLGVPKDIKQAYKWFALAAKGGDKEAIRRRDQALARLDVGDVKAAEDLVNAWRARPMELRINDARVAGDVWRTRAQEQAEETAQARQPQQQATVQPQPQAQAAQKQPVRKLPTVSVGTPQGMQPARAQVQPQSR